MRHPLCLLLSVLLFFTFSATLIGNEWANYYFPDTRGSYWVYEDENGDELTRYAVEPAEVEGETYRAFSYVPQLEDWAEFEYYVRPYFYQVSDEWVAFFIREETENAFKVRMTQQLEEALVSVRQAMNSPGLPEGVSFKMDYDIEVQSQDYFYLLPTPATFDEEWEAMRINATININFELQGLSVEGPEAHRTITSSMIGIERGNVVGTETVEVKAGTFEDCLKIVYQTETSVETNFPPELQNQMPEQASERDEALTTLWLAPNVGIVKWTQEQADEEAELELIEYEIKTTESGSDENN